MNWEKKLVTILLFLSTVIITIIFLVDLRNDYYFHFTKELTVATVRDLRSVSGNKPYKLSISYYNQHHGKEIHCSLKIDGRYGKKLVETSRKTLQVAYTEKNPFNVYILDYTHPTMGSFLLHIFLFLLGLFASTLLIWYIVKGKSLF